MKPFLFMLVTSFINFTKLMKEVTHSIFFSSKVNAQGYQEFHNSNKSFGGRTQKEHRERDFLMEIKVL